MEKFIGKLLKYTIIVVVAIILYNIIDPIGWIKNQLRGIFTENLLPAKSLEKKNEKELDNDNGIYYYNEVAEKQKIAYLTNLTPGTSVLDDDGYFYSGIEMTKDYIEINPNSTKKIIDQETGEKYDCYKTLNNGWIRKSAGVVSYNRPQPQKVNQTENVTENITLSLAVVNAGVWENATNNFQEALGQVAFGQEETDFRRDNGKKWWTVRKMDSNTELDAVISVAGTKWFRIFVNGTRGWVSENEVAAQYVIKTKPVTSKDYFSTAVFNGIVKSSNEVSAQSASSVSGPNEFTVAIAFDDLQRGDKIKLVNVTEKGWCKIKYWKIPTYITGVPISNEKEVRSADIYSDELLAIITKSDVKRLKQMMKASQKRKLYSNG
ncbi:hypothetical protein KKA66_01675 [Patescibacteria group bacterium]|nr:hypothetical protein [Patescibacteria group bacterium]